MATFSVVSHDGGPAIDAGIDLGAGGAKTDPRPSAAFRAEAATLDAPAPPSHAKAPPVTVLALPDLAAAQEASAEWWSSMGNRLFWVSIFLGALLALILIWNPGGPAPRQLDHAPTWSGQADVPHIHNDAVEQAAEGKHAPAWPPLSAANARRPQRAVHGEPPASGGADAERAIGNQRPSAPGSQGDYDEPPPAREAAPSFDEWTNRGQTPPAARTARSDDPHWDGSAPAVDRNAQPPVPPGEAAPTGIVNPW